jgi:signal transduction histidine kinase
VLTTPNQVSQDAATVRLLPQQSTPASPRLPELFHDLRQPITAILLLAEAAEGDSDNPEMIRRRLRQIRSEATWLNHLAEATRQGDGLRMLDLTEVVVDCVERTSITSAAHIVTEDVPVAHVLAPPVGLRQALTNIICNASRAAGAGGEVRVWVDVVEGDVIIHVSDDGPGFGRLPVVHGDGLGIARAALARFGGKLEITTCSTVGTCVSLVLSSCGEASHRGSA